MTEPLAWDEVAVRLARVLGEPVSGGLPLTPGWSSRTTWAAHGERTGSLVMKARRGERAYEKTAWCAARLPLLGARGHPVPAIIWHGMVRDQCHVTVQNRLPGHPLTGRLLEEVLQLVERQADAARAGGAAGPLCARIRRWLQPAPGLRLPPADYAHNDLNLSNGGRPSKPERGNGLSG